MLAVRVLHLAAYFIVAIFVAAVSPATTAAISCS